jgi:predicted outer membrane protein
LKYRRLVLADLDRRRGHDFDRAFVASEQSSLVRALRVLDETLIPKAVNKELAQRLSQARIVLAGDLSQARALADALSLP